MYIDLFQSIGYSRVSHIPLHRIVTIFVPSSVTFISLYCIYELYCIFLERGNTVNSENYCELLTQVKKNIKNKRRELQSRGVILLQDNARPHTAARTLAKIKDLGWKLLTHPPYSPDLAPSDFHLFGPLKESMKGIHFQTDEEVKAAVSNWLRTQSTEFYAKGIDNLISRWNKCVEKEGDYIEK